MTLDSKFKIAQAEAGDVIKFRGVQTIVLKDCGSIGGKWYCFEHQEWHDEEESYHKRVNGILRLKPPEELRHHSIVYVCPHHGCEAPLS